eukprot:scaffold9836_cov37-Prasinocladus_malaysianus.AAC.4
MSGTLARRTSWRPTGRARPQPADYSIILTPAPENSCQSVQICSFLAGRPRQTRKLPSAIRAYTSLAMGLAIHHSSTWLLSTHSRKSFPLVATAGSAWFRLPPRPSRARRPRPASGPSHWSSHPMSDRPGGHRQRGIGSPKASRRPA